MPSSSLYQWQYHDNKERSPLWYILAFSIAVGFIIWGFITTQYGMSIVIMIVTWLFYFIEINADEIVRVKIAENGIFIQENFYDYSKITAYSYVYSGDEVVYMRIFLKNSPIWTLSVRVNNESVMTLETILPSFIWEAQKQDLGMIDKISYFLKL